MIGYHFKNTYLIRKEEIACITLVVIVVLPFQEDKFYYGDVLKQTDVKIKSLLTPDCGASVLEEKVCSPSMLMPSSEPVKVYPVERKNLLCNTVEPHVSRQAWD